MKKIKRIEIDVNKCTGCRTCEAVCSAYHYHPKYSLINTFRSRIRVMFDEERDLYVPVLGGSFTHAECGCRRVYKIDGEEYGECSFCPTACPSRDLFKEPDSGLPLKCDMCGEPPPPEGPLCVAWCQDDALVYVEEEAREGDEPEIKEDLESAIGYLMRAYSTKQILEIIIRKTKGR